jgi:hypothetical protein
MALKLSTGLRNKLCGINSNKLPGFAPGDVDNEGTFNSAIGAGWHASDATATSVAGGQSGNCCQIAESGGINPGKIYTDVVTKVGHLYYIELYFKKGTADNGKFMIGTTADEDAIYDSGNLTDAAWALKRTWFLATATITRFTLQTNDTTAGETSLFDEVKIVSMSRSVQDVFKDGFIKIYTGTQPSSADDAVAGYTLLVTIYSDGASAGLEFDDAVVGVLSKKSTETWSGTAVASNTAGWFRLSAPGDTGALSTTEERIDGACGTSGAQLNMSSTTITSGAVQSISTFQLTMPAA